MKRVTEPQELFGETAAKALEAFTVLTDAGRKIFAQGVQLNAGGVREGARLYADLLESTSQALLRAAEQSQGTALEAARNFQQSAAEALDNVQKLYTGGEN